MELRCSKCSRRVTQPVHVGGVVFGSKCAEAVAGVKPARAARARKGRRMPDHKPAADPRQLDIFADDLAHAQRVDALLSSISLEMPHG